MKFNFNLSKLKSNYLWLILFYFVNIILNRSLKNIDYPYLKFIILIINILGIGILFLLAIMLNKKDHTPYINIKKNIIYIHSLFSPRVKQIHISKIKEVVDLPKKTIILLSNGKKCTINKTILEKENLNNFNKHILKYNNAI